MRTVEGPQGDYVASCDATAPDRLRSSARCSGSRDAASFAARSGWRHRSAPWAAAGDVSGIARVARIAVPSLAV